MNWIWNFEIFVDFWWKNPNNQSNKKYPYVQVIVLLIKTAKRLSLSQMLINGKDGDGDTPLHIALRREGEPDSTKEVPNPDTITDIVNSIRSTTSISKDLVYPVAIAHYLIRYVLIFLLIKTN